MVGEVVDHEHALLLAAHLLAALDALERDEAQGDLAAREPERAAHGPDAEGVLEVVTPRDRNRDALLDAPVEGDVEPRPVRPELDAARAPVGLAIDRVGLDLALGARGQLLPVVEA